MNRRERRDAARKRPRRAPTPEEAAAFLGHPIDEVRAHYEQLKRDGLLTPDGQYTGRGREEYLEAKAFLQRHGEPGRVDRVEAAAAAWEQMVEAEEGDDS